VNFEKALDRIKSIKLTGGVFGKTTLLLIVLCLCIAIVTLKIGTWWFALILMIPMMLLVFYALKRCLDFAEKNPQAAIMDGAEFLVHERIVHGRKGEEELPPVAATIDHQIPTLPEAEIASGDPPPTPVLAGKDDSKKEGV
jgi:hypothetical protein